MCFCCPYLIFSQATITTFITDLNASDWVTVINVFKEAHNKANLRYWIWSETHQEHSNFSRWNFADRKKRIIYSAVYRLLLILVTSDGRSPKGLLTHLKLTDLAECADSSSPLKEKLWIAVSVCHEITTLFCRVYTDQLAQDMFLESHKYLKATAWLF